MRPQKIETAAVVDAFQEDTSLSLSQPSSSLLPSTHSPAVSEAVSSEQQQHQPTSHKSTSTTSTFSSNVPRFSGNANSVLQHVTNGCMPSSQASIHSSSQQPDHDPHLHERVMVDPNNRKNPNNTDLCNCSSVVVTQSTATGHRVVHRLVNKPVSPTDSQLPNSNNCQTNSTTSV